MKEWSFLDYYGFILFFLCMDVDDAINVVKLENNKNKKQCLVKAKDYL
jgi:hypothetical protein